MENCPFCCIVKGELDAEVIWENERIVAFLDRKPVNPGHILIIPREHVPYAFDVEGPLYSELFETARMLEKPLKSAMQSVKVGLAIEGFGVDHAHLHLIPVNKSHDLDPDRARDATAEELRDAAERIRSAMR